MAGEGSKYAIVKTGGKQYKVAAGDVVKVEKLDVEPGAEVEVPARRSPPTPPTWRRSQSPVRCSSTPRVPRSASTSSRTRPAITSARAIVSS